MAAAQKFRGFRGDEVIAAARAAWVTQITQELEREGGLAMKTHGDAPLSVFLDVRSAVWRGRDCKVKVFIALLSGRCVDNRLFMLNASEITVAVDLPGSPCLPPRVNVMEGNLRQWLRQVRSWQQS